MRSSTSTTSGASKRWRALAAAMLLFGAAMLAQAADHRDAGLVTLIPKLDINDVYAFRSPDNEDNLVLIVTVNPFAGENGSTNFPRNMFYDLFVDVDADARREARVRTTFQRPRNGQQRVNVRGSGAGGKFTGSGNTGAANPLSNGGVFQAGVFDDPFFFDQAAFNNSFNFQDPGTDSFAGFNVQAIVIEIPADLFGEDELGFWAATRQRRDRPRRLDRMAAPLINAFFIAPDRRNAFNKGQPHQDRAKFRGAMVAMLTGQWGHSTQSARAIANQLLPDLLRLDLNQPGGYPNGRRLEDDVLDTQMNLASNGNQPTDFVDANDVPFLAEFPYLAPAH